MGRVAIPKCESHDQVGGITTAPKCTVPRDDKKPFPSLLWQAIKFSLMIYHQVIERLFYTIKLLRDAVNTALSPDKISAGNANDIPVREIFA